MSLLLRSRLGALNGRRHPGDARRTILTLLQRCYRCESRKYATANSGSSSDGSAPLRKQVTVLGDDGRVRWGDLTRKEKAARTTQQSFNLFVVVAGALLTVSYYPRGGPPRIYKLRARC